MRPLIDSFGRVHRDLRISVTDRCNYRCTYCMPEEGMQWLPRAELLTYEELARIAGVMVEQFGIDSIRLTGGEPTMRAHLPVLIDKLSRLRVPDPATGEPGEPVDLALTTNASTLRAQAHDLVAAGLARINISCDSLRPERFFEITKRDELAKVLDGIDAALEAGLDPVKLNVVVMRGVNDDEIVDFARFGRDHGVTVRFIEFMPLDAQGDWTNQQVVTQAEIIAAIDEVFPLDTGSRGFDLAGVEPSIVGGTARAGDDATPAERFRYLDGQGEVGVIPSVTHAFCDTCDRVRLTAEGELRTCLFALDEYDLRGPLRAGAADEELAVIIERAVGKKWAGHQINQVHFIRPRKSMSQIGG